MPRLSTQNKSGTNKTATEENGVRAIERAMQILDCFSADAPERTLSEISQCANLHKATTHRIVGTLLHHGFLERADDGLKYRLGLRLASIGFNVINRMDVRQEAIPYMKKVVQELDEACDLSIYDQGFVFYVEFMNSTHALQVAAAVGARLPAYCTASGKLMLSYLPEDLLDQALQDGFTPYTKNTLSTREALVQQLALIRSQGYAIDDEEFELGIRAVAAPIHDHSGAAVAAVSTPAPASRMSHERIPSVASYLIENARQISRRLGWKA